MTASLVGCRDLYFLFQIPYRPSDRDDSPGESTVSGLYYVEVVFGIEA